MKLYKSVGPNPRVVTLFLAEKGIEIPSVDIDLRAGENRRPPYVTMNPAGQTPALELDDGTILTEILAICEYLEELYPTPALIGSTPEERATTRMWMGRVNLRYCEPMANGFRFAEGLPMFKDRMRCLPEAADGFKAIGRDGLEWIEANMVGPNLTGERFTLADILLYAFLEFGGMVGQPSDTGLTRLNQLFAAAKSRPSVSAA